MEFLCSLNITDTGVNFRLFGKEYSTPWKDLSLLLGFDAQCVVDVDSAIQDFDKRDISRKTVFFVLGLMTFTTLLYALCING